MVIAPNNVRNFHERVIHYRHKIIGRLSIPPHQNQVVYLFMIHCHLAANYIGKSSFSLFDS